MTGIGIDNDQEYRSLASWLDLPILRSIDEEVSLNPMGSYVVKALIALRTLSHRSSRNETLERLVDP